MAGSPPDLIRGPAMTVCEHSANAANFRIRMSEPARLGDGQVGDAGVLAGPEAFGVRQEVEHQVGRVEAPEELAGDGEGGDADGGEGFAYWGFGSGDITSNGTSCDCNADVSGNCLFFQNGWE